MQLWVRIFQRLLLALYRQRFLLVAVVLIGGAAGLYGLWLQRSNITTESAAAGTAPIEVTIQDFQPRANTPTLTLKEKNGLRRISMNLGQTETLAIARERGLRVPSEQQPQVYDLLKDLINGMGARVDRVVVNDANSREYFAQVIVSNAGDLKVIKARPADAITLALKTGAPIFVEDKVLEQFGTTRVSS